jgi:putative hydrolase of the HAD superfamily
MNQLAEIRGIIFDFGKVVVDFHFGLAVDRLAAASGLPAERLAGLFSAQSPLMSRYESGEIGSDTFLAEVSRLCGHPFTEAEFVPIFTGIFTPIGSTIQLIRLLKQRYRLGLISNTNPWHFEHVIQPSEVFPLFDAVTLSFRAHALKPDPALFQDCLDQMGLMAEECVFIDDVAGYAEAATGNLLHGIHYTGHQDLLRHLRGLKVSFWKS